MAEPQKSQEKSQYGNSLDLVDIEEIRGNVVILKDGSMKRSSRRRESQSVPELFEDRR
jgi:hypothetical protein